MIEWIAELFQSRELTRMGHLQRVEDNNLGLGWLYYGLLRVLRPQRVVVIGSYRGFVPLVVGKALQDNTEKGEVLFIDPSLVDDFWTDPNRVREHFASFGVTNIRHFLMTTQQFVETDAYRTLEPIGMVFIDGYHTYEQARFDHEAFCNQLTPDGLALFHDSARYRVSGIYGPDRAYEHRVKDYLDELKRESSWQIFDLPFADGVSLVKRLQPGP